VQVAGSLVELTVDSNGSAPSTSICSCEEVTLASEAGAWAATTVVSPSPLVALTQVLSPPHRRPHLHPAWRPGLNRLPLRWHYWAAAYQNPPKGLQGCLVIELLLYHAFAWYH